MPNNDLLDRTLARIDENPREWNQKKFWCGTAGCFAGNALLEEGVAVKELQKMNYWNDVRDENQISSEARNRLGLSGATAYVLFDSENTRDMLGWIVDDIKNGKVQPWSFYAKKAGKR